MPSNSSTGGFLQPAANPGPLEGQALNRFVQQWVVGLSGLAGDMVRPRWQTEPPNIPVAGEAWAAIGIAARRADTFPYVAHDPSGNGADKLQRQEELDVLCSFYDQGTNGLADQLASLTRDNSAIAQNLEYLRAGAFALGYVGGLVSVPSLVKVRWLYRVDLPIVLRRQIDRVYPVENLLSATGTLETDVGLSKPIVVHN